MSITEFISRRFQVLFNIFWWLHFLLGSLENVTLLFFIFAPHPFHLTLCPYREIIKIHPCPSHKCMTSLMDYAIPVNFEINFRSFQPDASWPKSSQIKQAWEVKSQNLPAKKSVGVLKEIRQHVFCRSEKGKNFSTKLQVSKFWRLIKKKFFIWFRYSKFVRIPVNFAVLFQNSSEKCKKVEN